MTVFTYAIIYTLNDMCGLKTDILGTDVIDALKSFERKMKEEFYVSTFSVQAIRRTDDFTRAEPYSPSN